MNKLWIVAAAALILITGVLFVSAGGMEIIEDWTQEKLTKTAVDEGNTYPKIELNRDKPQAYYRITANSDNCITNCYTRGTAQIFTKGPLFNEIYVEDLGTSSKTKEADIKTKINYYIKIGEQNETVIVYESKEECTPTKAMNSTGGFSQVCKDIITTRNETNVKDIWKLYIPGTEVEPGNYTWMYAGTKEQNDYLDIKPSARGFIFEEWSEWGDGFNTGLAYYWDMSNDSASNIPDKVYGRFNYTTSAACNMTAASGKVGVGLGGLTVNCRANRTVNPRQLNLVGNNANGNLTIALWYRAVDNSASGANLWIWNPGTLQTSGAGNKGNVFVIKVNSNTINHWGNYWDYGDTEIAKSNGNQVAKAWVFYVIKRENGTFYSYVNGTKQSFTKAYAYNISGQSVYSQFFRRDAGAAYYHADVDELGVWNRSLTDTEIWDLYNNGTGLTYTIPEPEPPANSCTYNPDAGNWAINCSDYCNITSNVDLNGYNISIIGKGITTISANITNYKESYIKGLSATDTCTVYVVGGGKFGY